MNNRTYNIRMPIMFQSDEFFPDYSQAKQAILSEYGNDFMTTIQKVACCDILIQGAMLYYYNESSRNHCRFVYFLVYLKLL